MSTANTALRVTELDFIQIKENFKNYLRSQNQFQDFDFEGSGMSVLLDILAYNTHYMGYYLNMVGNEMFLDTAQLRSSILSHAKNINYVPASSQGALIKANVIATPTQTEDQSTNIITLEKYTKFLAPSIDGVNYPFVALYSNTTSKVGNAFYFNNIMLKQGEVVTRQYLMDATNTSRRFEIPSANVDLTTLSITVQQSSTNTSRQNYTLADDITELKGDSPVYFVEENSDLNYTFYFGDGVLGKKPDNGSVIIATYIDSTGSVANNISRVNISDPIGGKLRDNVTISVVGSSYGGTDKETIEQVRFRAPYFYTTQNRAVTKLDYETLITKDYNNIDSVAIWGGEDNDPVVYGKVFLSLKTKGNYFLTNLEKESIKDDLIRKRNVLTIIPEIVDPDFTYILIKGKIYYNSRLTSLRSNDILTLAKAAIEDYNERELNQFSSTFRKSKIQQYIENADSSITGSDISIYLQKRIPIVLNELKQYDINFFETLRENDTNDRFFSSPELQITDLNGVSRNIFFEVVPSADSGIREIIIENGGINYNTPPTVTITGDGTGATAIARVGGGRVTSIEITNPGKNYTFASVLLTGGNGSGARASTNLQINVKNIQSYYFSSSGEKIIIQSNSGLIDYIKGKITLSNILSQTGTPTNRYYDDDILSINCPVDNEILGPLRNRIISIDMNDPIAIQLEIIAE